MATIKPSLSFNPLSDAKELRASMKGVGTDEAAIIKIITKRTLNERLAIRNQYFQQFGRDLVDDLKSDLSGKFEKVILALLEPIEELLAREVYKAIDGFGTDDSILKGIICTLNPSEIEAVKAAYENLYGTSLEAAVGSDVSGQYKALLISLLTSARCNIIDSESAVATAKKLYSAGEGRLGTDEAFFIRVLSVNSFDQLRLIFKEYERYSGKDFNEAVENEISGDFKRAVKTFVKAVTNLPKLFAEQLRSAMKGTGTDYATLIRIIVWRAEKDLDLIKSEYSEHFGEGLAISIREETSGDCETALISMIEGN